MSKLEKIDRELEKAREKAAEWQTKIKDLEKQRQPRYYRFGPTWPEAR